MLSHCKYLLFFVILLINAEKIILAALPPAYLKELNIEEKTVSQEESEKTMNTPRSKLRGI